MIKEKTKANIKMSMKILIAEDNQYTALQYNKILQKYGHDVIIVKDGQECISKYEESAGQKEFEAIEKNPFDVVILDQSMPKKTGSQVAEEILEQKPGQRIIFCLSIRIDCRKKLKFFQRQDRILAKTIFAW